MIAIKLRIRVYFWGRAGVRLDGAHREPSGVTDKALSLDWPQQWLEGCCLIIQTIQLFCVTFWYLCLINDKGFEARVPYSSSFSLVLLYWYLGLGKLFTLQKGLRQSFNHCPVLRYFGTTMRWAMYILIWWFGSVLDWHLLGCSGPKPHF